MKTLGLLIALVLSVPFANAQEKSRPEAGERRKTWNFGPAGLIPVQAGGRFKPFDTYAREVVLSLTSSRTYQGWDPVDLMFSLISAPEVWQKREFIKINHQEVKRQLLLDESRSRFSPEELLSNPAVAQYASAGVKKNTISKENATAGTSLQPVREKEFERVIQGISLFRALVSGEAWGVIPERSPEPWKSLAQARMEGLSSTDRSSVPALYAEMIRAYYSGDQTGFESASEKAREAVEQSIANLGAPRLDTLMRAERLYNEWHPFLWAWILYLLSAILWAALGAGANSKLLRASAWVFLGLGFAVHTLGFAFRCYIAGRPPVSNMYESIVWVAFGVLFFGLILYYYQRQLILLATSCFLAAFGLIAADAAPAVMDPGIHPLVPVLRSNLWLTVHVLTITISYAAFALSMGLADVSLFQFAREKITGRSFRESIDQMNQLAYRSMQYGVVLLAAGTILGGVWADYSWGRFWGWDPKEVWALIALLCYLAVLHGRYAGWVGRFGFAVWTVVSFLSVMMAWYGVNFILGVGLHSYGFTSGASGGVWIGIGIKLAYVLGCTAIVKGKNWLR
jgi:cytochrome c-type biogenesis protein CcsB